MNLKAWIAGLVVAISMVALPAAATLVLVDFGTTNSYRGWTAASPDSNGNYWNSVDSTAYWQDLVDQNGNATTIDFGFVGGFVGGPDSYNGPAGETSVTGPGNASSDYTGAVIDSLALGPLGGSHAAAFDYYTTSGFVLNGLDPNYTYNLTFFGSHMYNDDNVTVYGAYTDGSFSSLITSVNLTVGVDADHNSNTVATLSGLTPEAGGSLYIYYRGQNTQESGYLNAFSIQAIPEPTTLGLLGVGALCLTLARRAKRG